MGIEDREEFEVGITRRLLARRALQAGGAAALISPSAFLSACFSSDDDPKSGGASKPGARGGTMGFASNADPGRIGTNFWGVEGFIPGYALFDRLYELSPDAKSVIPGLATALPEAGDGKTFRIKLREGIKFHDGSPLTAEDVKYTIERQLDPANGSDAKGTWQVFGFTGAEAFTDGKAKEVEGLQVIDPHTIELNLDKANASLPFWLSMSMASIVPKAYGTKVGYEKFEQKPIGTGPFKLVSYQPKKMLKLARNENYHRDDVPYADQVEWAMSVDPELSLLRIRDGQLDIMLEPIPPGKMATVRQDPTFQSRVQNDCIWVAMCLDNPYTKDLRVRQAISHAIDKEKLVRQLSGMGDTDTHGFFSSLSPYWQDDFPTYPFDPEKAKSLLAEAGHPKGFDIQLLASANFPYNVVGQAIQADLGVVGIKVDAKIIPSSELNSIWLTPENTGLTVARWELPYPHGSYIVDGAWVSSSVDSGGGNFSHLRSKEIDKLADEGRQTTDVARQVEIYKEIDRTVIGEMALWVPLLYPKFSSINAPRLHGYEPPAGPSGDTKVFANYSVA